MASVQKLRPLHNACLMDDKRLGLSLIEIKKGIATAFNGRVLVKIDLLKDESGCHLTRDEVKLLDGMFIHMNVWKDIYKCDSLEFDGDGIYCGKDGILKTYHYSNPPSQTEMFTHENMVTDAELAGEEKKRIIFYSADDIAVAASVFQCSDLNFSFSKGNEASFVFPFYDCGMFAVIKPNPGVENRYFFK